MIRAKFNLRCKAGHKHYAPQPELWVGRQCFAPLVRDDSATRRRCAEPMVRMKDAARA